MRKRILLLFLLTAPCYFLGGQVLRVGAAKTLITPQPLLPVSGGIGTPSPVSRKRGDLWVRAMVLELAGERVAIVGIDNLGWPKVLGDRSRALVSGIKPGNILIGATHTHSGPDAYGFPDETGTTAADLEYLEDCVQKVAETIQDAINRLEPALLRVANDDAKGKIAYNYYATDLYDPRCGIIQAAAREDTNRVIATLVNYAVHPEVIGSDQGILSPDLCGPLYDYIESEVGGTAIFMNGAQGGMVTADNRKGLDSEARDWEECQRIGNLLASEALRIVDQANWEDQPEISCVEKTVSFPVESEMLKTIMEMSPLTNGLIENDSISSQVNLVRIGSAQILTIPGEALPNIGYYLKRIMSCPNNFLFGLTNDAFGYMLTKVDFNSFEKYRYVSRTSLGEMTGEIFIEAAMELIESDRNR